MSSIKSPFGFKSIIELVSYFKDEMNCLDYLEQSKWGGGPVICDKCGHDKVYRFKDGKRYKCAGCKHHFTAKVGTIFQDSKVPMIKWIMAMYLLGTLKKGLSTRQLAAEINVSQKTSWFMMHRIRQSFVTQSIKMSKAVCADECWIGGRNKNRHLDKKAVKDAEGNYNDKAIVVGIGDLVEGKVKCFVVPDRTLPTLNNLILENVERGSIVVTDEHSGYGDLHKEYFHELINHQRRQYVSECGFSTNRIEGFWNHMKKSINGIYHNVSRKHLQRYVNESVFRYNFRNDSSHMKLHAMMRNIHQPLKYKQLIKDESKAA